MNKENWFALIAGIVVILFLVFYTPANAQSEYWQYATENTDASFVVMPDSIVNCNREIDRAYYLTEAKETPETGDYQLATVNWSVPNGEVNCFASYEISGQHLYAIRATEDMTCQVEYARVYCWKVITRNSNLLIYGKWPENVFEPIVYADEQQTWAFFFYSTKLPILIK